MRIAIISDIHGNSTALDAVLADSASQGAIDAYWILGDFSSMGPDPVGVLERITKLPNVSFLQGNHDRYIITGKRPGPTLEQAQADNKQIPFMMGMATNLAWTQGQILASGWWDWFTRLPMELRLTLPDGTRLLGVHVAPGLDDGPGIIPPLSNAELQQMLAPAKAELVIVGHTHVPMDRTVGQTRVFNLGSVSNPMRSRLEATYAILDANTNGYTLQLRYADYDHQAVINELQRLKHPTADWIAQMLRGEIRPLWAH